MKKLLTLICFAGIAVSCNNMNKTDNTGSTGMAGNDMTASNETRMQAFYDQVINAHNVSMVDSFTTADFVDHNPSPGHSGKGLEDTKASFQEWFMSMPDVHVKTNFMMSKGDTIMAEVTMTGTNTGPMGKMPATNKSMNIDGVDIVVIKDGKAVERWGYFEDMKMMQQMGMLPDMNKSETEKMVEDKMKENEQKGAQKMAPKKK